jgi:hypothetical protein
MIGCPVLDAAAQLRSGKKALGGRHAGISDQLVRNPGGGDHQAGDWRVLVLACPVRSILV